MSDTDRALHNGEYVRRLLQKKWPEFAAVLERAVWEMACLTITCNQPDGDVSPWD